MSLCILHAGMLVRVRSEREAKVLRLETEDLRKKAFSLRTRLACAQGRHQTQLEMANKRIKVCRSLCVYVSLSVCVYLNSHNRATRPMLYV